MEEEPEVRITISRVLNVGYSLKERLERVAAAEGVDATYLVGGSLTLASRLGSGSRQRARPAMSNRRWRPTDCDK